MPRVTVLTAAYNRAELMRETLDSVLSQDYPDFEYLVLDDGSPDHTIDVLKEYAAKYGDKFRWDTHPNMGEHGTFNRGFNMAKGEMVAFVCSDDVMRPGWLKTLVSALDANPNAVLAYSDYDHIDAQSNVIGATRYTGYHQLNLFMYNGAWNVGPGVIFRKDVFFRVGPRIVDLRYASDIEFVFRCSLCGPFVQVHQLLAAFRVHSGGDNVAPSLSYQGSYNRRYVLDHIVAVEKFFTYSDLPTEVRALHNEMLSRAHYYAATIFSAYDGAAAREHMWQSMQYFPRLGARYQRSWVRIMRVLFLPLGFNKWLVNLLERVRGIK
jgi:glycosyltransferase involved in cell wall biosynthesis